MQQEDHSKPVPHREISFKFIHLSNLELLRSTPILTAALLIGGGLFTSSTIEAAEQATNSSPHVEDALAAALPSQTPPSINSSLNGQESSLVGNEIEYLDRITSDYARSVALRKLLYRSDEQQILDLLEQTKGISNRSRKFDTQIEIYRRFAAVDPIEALQHVSSVFSRQRGPLMEAIFGEWAHSDFESAIAQAKTLAASEQTIALKAILETRSNWSEDEIITYTRELGHAELTYQVLEESYLAQAIIDPESAWMAITNDSRDDDLQHELLAEILELWCLRDGAQVLLEVEDMLAQMRFGKHIVFRAISEQAGRDPEASLELARSFQSDLRDYATRCVISEWAGDEPLEALQAVSKIDPGGSLQISLERLVVSSWDNADPRGLLDNVSSFSEGVQSHAEERAMSRIARTSPDEAAKLLVEFPNGINEYGAAIAQSWARKNVRKALDWVLSLDDLQQPRLLRWLSGELLEEDHELAFEIFLSQPVTRAGFALEADGIERLAATDLELAISLLPRVRDHYRTKDWAYLMVSRALVERNEYDRAMELGQELHGALRNEYYPTLFSEWAWSDAVSLFESLDELPNTELKLEAANAILTFLASANTHHRYFSERQIQEIKNHLDEDGSD